MRNIKFLAAVLLFLSACDSNEVNEEAKPVRGLVTVIVQSSEETTLRRYPGVLEPGEITNLSFDVGGKLGKIELNVGQSVEQGEVLASLDSDQFETRIENLEAAARAAQIELNQDKEDLDRKSSLLSRGAATRVSVEEATTQFNVSQQRLVQANKELESARQDLEETIMTAPYAGVINSIETDSFATVSAGTPVVSLYSAQSYEVSFSVSFDVLSRLVVGTPARIRLADDPAVILEAVVSELGDRADTVSSFPVIVRLTESNPIIKSGMAVEVAFEFSLPADVGYLIPISAAAKDGPVGQASIEEGVERIGMFVFDPETSTVRRREVSLGGIRDNKFLIIDGLSAGEHVAVAGVSFLREGMKVKLLETEE